VTFEQILTLLVGNGGAIVAMLLWNWDLRKQRDREHAERREDAAAMRTLADGVKELTGAVKELLPPTPTRSLRK
jgi:hypothetical protein